MTGQGPGFYHVAYRTTEQEQAVDPEEYVPDWAFYPSHDRTEVEQAIERVSRGRVRKVIPYGEPQGISIEDIVSGHLPEGGLRMDEYVNAIARRGHYVACRRVETVETPWSGRWHGARSASGRIA